MALKFYLGQIDTNHEINCDTNSSITEIAGSFNLGNFVLEWNECEHAIFPNTKFFIVDTTSGKKYSYIISQDNVEVVKKTSPVKYLHTLTLTQNTHELNMHQLRNTLFNQPFDKDKKYNANFGFSILTTYNASTHQPVSYNGNAVFFKTTNSDEYLKKNYSSSFESSKAKIKDAKIKVSSYLVWYGEEGRDTYDNTTHYFYRNYVDNKKNSLDEFVLRFVNYADATDYFEMTVTNTSYPIKLNNTQLQWLVGKRFYIKPISAHFPQPTNLSCDPYSQLSESANILGFIQVDFDATYYYYSLWDVLDIINKQYKKQYNGASLPDLYTMPSKDSGKGLILDQTVAPELDFSQSDVFNAVAQTLNYIDAFPVLNENNVLDFVYLNDLSEDVITNLQITDKKTTLSEENFTNRIITTYQNARQENAITYPAKNLFKKVGATNFGVVDRNDYWFLLDKPIDYIDSLIIKLGGSITATITEIPDILNDYNNIFYSWAEFPMSLEQNEIDITHAVYRNDLYSLLEENSAYNEFPNKNNTIYYSKGDNKIYAGITGNIDGTGQDKNVIQFAVYYALAYKFGFRSYLNYITFNANSRFNKQDTYFNCTYHALFDGRVAHESTTNKYNGETTVAQANSGVELNKMGNNMQGLIAKLGNEQKTFSFPITSFGNRATIGSLWVDDNGEQWILSRIKTTFSTSADNVLVEGTFTKNFNALAQYTKLNQEKRFYDIDTQLTSKGYENINEYIYFTNRDIDISQLSEEIALTRYALESMFIGTFSGLYYLPGYNYQIEYVNVRCQESVGVSSVASYIPIHTYGNGNQICFEMGFESPNNAGNRIVEEGGKIINKASLYTAESGFADLIHFRSYFYDNSTPIALPNTFPNYEMTGILAFNLTNYYYYKKPNEILHLNYSICFLPYFEKELDSLGTPIYTYDEIFFGDAFINENAIIPNNDYTKKDVNVSNLHIWVSTEKYSMLDKKAFGTELIGCFAEINMSGSGASRNTYGSIEFTDGFESHDLTGYNSWCIADDLGNIYLAVNKGKGGNAFNIPKLKFFTSRFRKN